MKNTDLDFQILIQTQHQTVKQVQIRVWDQVRAQVPDQVWGQLTLALWNQRIQVHDEANQVLINEKPRIRNLAKSRHPSLGASLRPS